MHAVLVNRLGGLSLPRKSVVRLTDRPDMTLDVYRGRKTTNQIKSNSKPSCLAKAILQGTVKEKRKRVRQQQSWKDNIKEWTGMDLAGSTGAVESRTRGKGIVANSSVVARRPSKVMG